MNMPNRLLENCLPDNEETASRQQATKLIFCRGRLLGENNLGFTSEWLSFKQLLAGAAMHHITAALVNCKWYKESSHRSMNLPNRL